MPAGLQAPQGAPSPLIPFSLVKMPSFVVVLRWSQYLILDELYCYPFRLSLYLPFLYVCCIYIFSNGVSYPFSRLYNASISMTRSILRRSMVYNSRETIS